MIIEANFPAFLRKEPLIWGISISDLFRLSGVLVVMQFLGASSIVILGAVFISYLGLVMMSRLFTRRYFEFYFKKKRVLRRKELNNEN